MTETVLPNWRHDSDPATLAAVSESTRRTTRTRRRHERRQLRLYYFVAFGLCLPVVAMSRLAGGGKAKERSRQSLASETSSKVSAMLGFGFMA